MLDRTKAPLINDIGNLKLQKPRIYTLDNGIPVYEISMGTQEILKLEIVFNAGRPYEKKRLASRATANLLKEGTTKNHGAYIAEEIDFYGASLNFPVNLDNSNITLYCLKKHFKRLIPLLTEILTSPAFPQKELDLFIQNNQQRLQVDLSKGDVIAYRKITEYIFGESHPYGYNSLPKTYAELKRSDLIEHFNENYISNNCSIFISGKTDANIIKLLNQYLGNAIPSGHSKNISFKSLGTTPQQIKIEHPDSMQTAIRIGKELFNRAHPNSSGMYVLNTVLGGYFSSRLMKNIREEKGYTYNIYSSADMMKHSGTFCISTEVGNEFVEDTLKEIYKELKKIQEEPIAEEELQMVRNYLMGNFLTMLDGPFNVADVIRTFVLDEVPLNSFDELISTIKNISSKDLQLLSQKYFDRNDLWEVIVGT